MKRDTASSVAIILLPGFSVSALGVLVERFTLAGGQSPLIFSCSGDKMVAAEHGVRVQAQVLPQLPLAAQTLICCGGREYKVTSCEALAQVARHARVASCSIGIGGGVLFMAEAGLLDGRRVSLAEPLRGLLARSGRAQVCEATAFSRDDDVWTCADEESLPLMLDALLPTWSWQKGDWRGQGHEKTLHFHSEVADRSTLAEAQALMRNNLTEPLTTAEIAGYLGISCKKLERIFKRFVGQLPARFYIGLRLCLARDLLHHSGLSIEEIGKRSGFSSPSHFSRAFRNHFGCTPRSERQQFAALSDTENRWCGAEKNRRCIAV
ncbi:HTH-type transcriptional regulator CdhR [Microbulbifer aestuariivivens]|uniref:HTH-type transcriptional regulator CdhR n=1 Tax=Microbulbifer aestuariivivens TaxID=1908308 RepID=A0ABM5PB23_9GAMM